MSLREQLRAIYLRLTLVQRIGVSVVSFAVAVGMVWLVSGARATAWPDADRTSPPAEGDVPLAHDDSGQPGRGVATTDDGGSEPGGWADSWREASAGLGQFALGSQRADAKEMARAAQLSRLLTELPDIEHADVVWDSETRVGWRQPPRVRATVYLKPAHGRQVTPDVVEAVRRAVAGSKAHLDPSDVVVMDLTEMVAYGADAGGSEASQLALEAAQLERRIERALEHLPDVRVRVSVQAGPSAEPAQAGPHPTYASTAGGPNQRLQLSSESEDSVTEESGGKGASSRMLVFVAVPSHVLRQRIEASGSPSDQRAELVAEVEALVAAATSSHADQFPLDLTVTVVPDTAVADTAEPAVATDAPTPLQLRITWFLGILVLAGLATIAWQFVLRARQTRRPSPATTDRVPNNTASAAEDDSEPAVRGQTHSRVAIAAPEPEPMFKQPLPTASPVTAADIERLAGLSPQHLQAVYAEFPTEVWQTALVGVSPKICAQLLAALPDAEATTLRRSLARQRPVRLRDVEDAQARVAARAVQVSTAW